jgi:hypothetical protein
MPVGDEVRTPEIGLKPLIVEVHSRTKRLNDGLQRFGATVIADINRESSIGLCRNRPECIAEVSKATRRNDDGE